MSAWRRYAPLGLILVAAAGLRLWSIGHGLPYSYNLDERAHFVPHAVAMTGGDLNPGYFINPPALTYLLAAVFSIVHLGGVEQWFADDPTAVFLTARVVSAILGVAAVWATYAAGRAWFGRTAGLVAAAIVAVAFLPVFYSRLALNDGPAMLPCALALWSAAIVLRTGSKRALLAGGAAVGLAASLKYSDGAVAVALAAAAFLSPLRFRDALKWLLAAGVIALAVVLVTNPYLLVDWSTFINDLDRQRKFADGAPLLGQPERNGWVYYVRSSRWTLGVLPGLAALAGGIALLVKGRRREAVVLGSLVVLYFLYMGHQSRFYARWMLPLFPALAILAAYALTLIRRRALLAAAVAVLLAPSLLATVRNAIVLGREDTRTITRDWLVANLKPYEKVVFEPIAPTEWYGVTAGGGRKASKARQWTRFNRSRELIAELARDFRGARYPASFQNYERTLWPGMLDVYRRGGYCWIVTGSTQYGRARTEPRRVPEALAYYRELRRQADVKFRISPAEKLPRYQFDTSFNYAGDAYERPGPEMIVYRLRDCP